MAAAPQPHRLPQPRHAWYPALTLAPPSLETETRHGFCALRWCCRRGAREDGMQQAASRPSVGGAATHLVHSSQRRSSDSITWRNTHASRICSRRGASLSACLSACTAACLPGPVPVLFLPCLPAFLPAWLPAALLRPVYLTFLACLPAYQPSCRPVYLNDSCLPVCLLASSFPPALSTQAAPPLAPLFHAATRPAGREGLRHPSRASSAARPRQQVTRSIFQLIFFYPRIFRA